MNPVKTIGRYEIPIASVVMISQRTGLRAWLRPGFDVLLASGVKFRLTKTEKLELDAAREHHNQVMQVYGMIAEMKANNRP